MQTVICVTDSIVLIVRLKYGIVVVKCQNIRAKEGAYAPVAVLVGIQPIRGIKSYVKLNYICARSSVGRAAPF